MTPTPHAEPVQTAVCQPCVVVHEDADLLVLDKPAGLLCVPGRGADKQDALSTRAQALWPDALIVHRLDMATSGLVLMARSAAVQRALGDAFAARQIGKRYEAVVDGLPAETPDADGWSLIDAPLMADWPRRPLQKIDAAGKPSQTRWRVLRNDTGGNTTLLELEPLTGRTHQLRLHLASIGHAIAGDALYADARVQALAPRLMLHARSLVFSHPVSGKPMRLDRPGAFSLTDAAD